MPAIAKPPIEPGIEIQSLPLARTASDRAGGEMPAELGNFSGQEIDRQHAGETHNQPPPVANLADHATPVTPSVSRVSATGEQQQSEIAGKTAPANEETPSAGTGQIVTPPADEHSDVGEKVRVMENYEKSRSPVRAVEAAVHPAAPRVTSASYAPRTEKHTANESESASVVQQTGRDAAGEARSLNTVARNFSQFGSNQKALDVLNTALVKAQESGDRVALADTQNAFATVYSNMGEQQTALNYVNKALPVLRKNADPAMLASALNVRGVALAREGHRDQAFKDFQEALANARSADDHQEEAVALSNIGKIYEEEGKNQDAVNNYTRALAEYENLGDSLGEADTMFLLFDYWREHQNPSLAIFFGKEAIDRYQLVRAQMQSLEQEDQKSFVHSKELYYREIADSLIGEGRLPEAQEVLDLLKMEEYTAFSQRRGAAHLPSDPLPKTNTEEIVDTEIAKRNDAITALGRQWSALKVKKARTPEDDVAMSQLGQKLTAANQQLQEFLKNLYSSFGKGEQANRTIESVQEDIGSLQNIQHDLGSDTAALYTLVLDNKVEIILITAETKVAHEIAVPRADLRLKVFSFVSALANHSEQSTVLAKSAELYKLLVAPIEKDLTGARAKTLLWSLDDVLRYVPVAALYDGKQFLVEHYQSSVITSASIGNLRDQPHINAWSGVAMGVSKDYDGLGELKAVPDELDSVVHAENIPGSHGPMPGTILLDDSFTEKNMEAALDKHAPLVHVASHFVFRPGDDTKSYLLLGGKDTGGGKGFRLTLADLRDDQGLDFSGIELLTVAGCQTAVDSKDSDGREIDGLGIVAQRKGAKAVVATLWPVDDASVGLLMSEFYKNWITMPGITKAEALRLAQVSLLRGTYTGAAASSTAGTANGATPQSPYASPYYWAPFILIGNWK